MEYLIITDAIGTSCYRDVPDGCNGTTFCPNYCPTLAKGCSLGKAGNMPTSIPTFEE